MIEKLNEKRKEEWESIKDEEERKIRKEKQEMQENLWKWRSSQKVLEKDPREKLTSERKITILEELLEKEKKEKEKRIEKIATEKIKWQTIREERKQERKERLEKQEKLQNGWKNIRWALKEMKNVEDSSDYLEIKILAEKSTLKHLNKQKFKFKKKYKKVFQSVHNLGSILEMNQDESNSMEDGILDDGDRLVLDAIPDGELPHPVMNGESATEEMILEDGDRLGPDDMLDGESPPPGMIQEEEMTTTNLEMTKEEMTVDMKKNLDDGHQLGP